MFFLNINFVIINLYVLYDNGQKMFDNITCILNVHFQYQKYSV